MHFCPKLLFLLTLFMNLANYPQKNLEPSFKKNIQGNRYRIPWIYLRRNDAYYIAEPPSAPNKAERTAITALIHFSALFIGLYYLVANTSAVVATAFSNTRS